ncbi:hypothetical protein HHI36_013247 [Cryptolaemus montrouzieri]|uniref:DNA/RNA non-specific endonuclease/pyrophosphatase/phosphodiesterase domain-containing protein n=1 Tax=Cryptolaemus montrouzieri TaxID=559131 RepID=A0ABD2NGT5_9CUCU
MSIHPKMLRKSIIIGIVVFVILAVGAITAFITHEECCKPNNCEIPPIHKNAPLYARFYPAEFVYPNHDHNLILEKGESITVGCPGSKLNIGVISIEVTCISGTLFSILGNNLDITSLYCENKVKSIARYTNKLCENDGQEIEVGFKFNNTQFLRQIRICFNVSSLNPLYSEHNLTRFIDNRDKPLRRPFLPPFKEASFYNLNTTRVYKLYNTRNQRETINQQLEISSPNSTEVIKDGFSFYLTRGHLSPNPDFVYISQQDATYYYFNTAPQWGIINSKSWIHLNWRIISFASKINKTFRIFTGTFGNLVLNKYSSHQLHLYYNPPSEKIPIPEVFWKVVYEEIDQLGVAFIGTNNPFLNKHNLKLLCNDISKSVKWIEFNNKNMTEGFIYACEVDDLRKTIKYIPQLHVNGILSK